MACDKANLTSMACQNFKALLGALNVIDPLSAHADDEPRNRRDTGAKKPKDEKKHTSVDYYDTLDEKKSASGKNNAATAAPLPDCEAIKRQVDAKAGLPKLKLFP